MSKVTRHTIPVRRKQSRDWLEKRQAEYAKDIVEIVIPWVPPTANQWERMHWGKRLALKKVYYEYLWATYRDAVLPCPCTIVTQVFKRNPRRGDAHNLTTPVDKLILDALTSPRGRKTRGLGLLPDDSPDYVTLATPSIHKCHSGEEERTVMKFEPKQGRTYR